MLQEYNCYFPKDLYQCKDTTVISNILSSTLLAQIQKIPFFQLPHLPTLPTDNFSLFIKDDWKKKRKKLSEHNVI